jgi:phytoene dehydrogenase-like protein
MELLEGRYADDRVREMCLEPADETNWSVHVFLGVRRDLSQEPSALIMLLDSPVTIAGHANRSLEMQIYGFDRSMAPAGRGVIKVELVSAYSYWKRLQADRAAYEAEKKRVAAQVVELLERRFLGIGGQVEAVDVPTVLTWERYMGGTHGFANFPNKKTSPLGMMTGRAGETTLPGLSNFRFVGAWATMTGALFGNVLSGRNALRALCRQDGRPFRAEARS